MQSAASDLSLLEAAAREAGAIARAAFGKPMKSWSKGPGQPVTEIDLAVNALLEEKLRAARPEYGWLSEESPDDPARLKAERVWLVDPIDGTRAFMDAEPQFTISIGVVENGRAIAGAVYNPIRDRLYLGALGAGASFNGAPMQVTPRAELEGAELFVRRAALKRSEALWPELKLTMRASLAYRLALVAAGRADAAILDGYKHEWDVAAGAALIAAAGGVVTDLKGAPLVFNLADPRQPGVVAAGAALHPLLIERTARLAEPFDDPAPAQETAT